MNLPKSSRYHRARRRADGAAILAWVALLMTLLLTRASVAVRAAVNDSPAAYAAVLSVLAAAVLVPFAWYRDYRLERQYGLSDVRFGGWVVARLKAAAIVLAVAIPLAEFVYRAMRWPSVWGWLPRSVVPP